MLVKVLNTPMCAIFWILVLHCPWRLYFGFTSQKNGKCFRISNPAISVRNKSFQGGSKGSVRKTWIEGTEIVDLSKGLAMIRNSHLSCFIEKGVLI